MKAKLEQIAQGISRDIHARNILVTDNNQAYITFEAPDSIQATITHPDGEGGVRDVPDDYLTMVVRRRSDHGYYKIPKLLKTIGRDSATLIVNRNGSTSWSDSSPA